MNELQRKMIRMSVESEVFLGVLDNMVDLTLPNGQIFYRQRVKQAINVVTKELEKITNYVLRPDKSDNDAAQKQMFTVIDHVTEGYDDVWNNIDFAFDEAEAFIEQEKSDKIYSQVRKAKEAAKYTLESKLKRLDLTDKEIKSILSKPL